MQARRKKGRTSGAKALLSPTRSGGGVFLTFLHFFNSFVCTMLSVCVSLDSRTRQLITLRVACVCPHTDTASPPRHRNSAVKPPSPSSPFAPTASAAAAAATATSKEGEAVDPASQGRRPREEAESARPCCGEPLLPPPRGRRHALPPMVALLKVWAPNEATAALLLEGAELRLHRFGLFFFENSNGHARSIVRSVPRPCLVSVWHHRGILAVLRFDRLLWGTSRACMRRDGGSFAPIVGSCDPCAVPARALTHKHQA